MKGWERRWLYWQTINHWFAICVFIGNCIVVGTTCHQNLLRHLLGYIVILATNSKTDLWSFYSLTVQVLISQLVYTDNHALHTSHHSRFSKAATACIAQSFQGPVSETFIYLITPKQAQLRDRILNCLRCIKELR